MESNRTKRSRNLISKSKFVMSLYRATKPSSAAHKPYKPAGPTNPSEPIGSATAGSALAGFIIVNQDKVFPQQTPKVAFVAVTDRINRDSNAKMESFYGGLAEDEAVDAKAAKYISRVQESFRLERVNSERKSYE